MLVERYFGIQPVKNNNNYLFYVKIQYQNDQFEFIVQLVFDCMALMRIWIYASFMYYRIPNKVIHGWIKKIGTFIEAPQYEASLAKDRE